MAVINPFDFFVEPFAETFPFAYPAEFAEELAPYLDAEPAGPRLSAFLASISARSEEHRRFPGRTQSTPATRNPLSDPHGNRRADAGANAGGKFRLVSRQRMAAGANSATSGARSPVRVGLPHPVEARLTRARRAGRRGAGLHRSARLGRGLRAGRGLDRARRHVRSVMRRRASAARRHAAFSRRGADQRRGRACGSRPSRST